MRKASLIKQIEKEKKSVAKKNELFRQIMKHPCLRRDTVTTMAGLNEIYNLAKEGKNA